MLASMEWVWFAVMFAVVFAMQLAGAPVGLVSFVATSLMIFAGVRPLIVFTAPVLAFLCPSDERAGTPSSWLPVAPVVSLVLWQARSRDLFGLSFLLAVFIAIVSIDDYLDDLRGAPSDATDREWEIAGPRWLRFRIEPPLFS